MQEDDQLAVVPSPEFTMAGVAMRLLWYPRGHPLSRKQSCSLYLECMGPWLGCFRLQAGSRTRLYLHHFKPECPRWGDADFMDEVEKEGPLELSVEILDTCSGPWPVIETASAVHLALVEHARRRSWATQGDGLLGEECTFGRLLWCPCGMCSDPEEPWWDPRPALYIMVWEEDGPRPAMLELWHDGALAFTAPVLPPVHPGLGRERWTPAICCDLPARGECHVRLHFAGAMMPHKGPRLPSLPTR